VEKSDGHGADLNAAAEWLAQRYFPSPNRIALRSQGLIPIICSCNKIVLIEFRGVPDLDDSTRIFLSDAACGVAQQMVFWGHDVRHPAGNVLVRYGMVRSASSGLQGTSCYSAPWEEGTVELHGAIASWTPPRGGGGVTFCRDHRRIALWQGSAAPIPGREYGIAGSAEARWSAFQPLLRWLVGYEQWIEQSHGPAWRAGCWRALKRLPRGKPWLPPPLALKWWQLAAAGDPPRPKFLLEH
jgi:hypothetical protein